MDKELFTDKAPIPVDDHLNIFENIRKEKESIIAKETETIKNIREGFEEVIVIFIDMVDSTKFKTSNQETPEKWILRVRQFSEIVSKYIIECSGRVVKYIGDELMAIFNRESKINDAINLLNRINDLQKDLTEITEEPTTVKIAVDFGKVYFLAYSGHDEPDPQGTPIDRCARIAKYCKPGTILTSYEFVKECVNSKLWSKIGEAELKGIGRTSIFQFGECTCNIVKMVEIQEDEHKLNLEKIYELNSKIEDMTIKYNEALSINSELVKQITKSDGEVLESNILKKNTDQEDEEKSWKDIKTKIIELKKIIGDSPVPAQDYARFLFLYFSDKYWEYNSFSGNTFDECIENNLVIPLENNSLYQIDPKQRRNKKALQIMDDIEYHLEIYENKFRNNNDDDDDDLYDYSLKTPEFWRDYIGINV